MSMVTGVALAANQDKRLELVATSGSWESAGLVRHAWQGQGHSWTGWHRFPQEPPDGVGPQGPAVARNANGCLEVVVGNDGAVWHAAQTRPNNDWSGWDPLAPPGEDQAISTPALAQNKKGRLEVFVARDDYTVWHAERTAGGWSRWDGLGPSGVSWDEPAVARNKDGRLELFVVRNDRMWHRWERREGRWSEWDPLGQPSGTIGPRLALAQNKDGRLEVFAVRDEHPRSSTVWHCWRQGEGNWSGWHEIAQPSGNRFRDRDVYLGAGANANGQLVLFAIAQSGEDAIPWLVQQVDGWSRWSSFDAVATKTGSNLATGPSVRLALRADGRLELSVLFSTGGCSS